MSKFKIKFVCESEEYCVARKTLQFLPRVGDMLAIFNGDDFREVDQVYWHVKTGYEVYFKDTHWTVKQMVDIGWKEDK